MKLFSFTIKNDWIQSEHGWGNGYVAIPPEHPLYGKKYNDKIEVNDIDKIPFNGNFLSLLTTAFEFNKDEKDKNLVPLDLVINVHGGITLSDSIKRLRNVPKNIPEDYWVFGFDTVHAGDNQFNWKKEDVQKETKKFKRQLEKFNNYGNGSKDKK